MHVSRARRRREGGPVLAAAVAVVLLGAAGCQGNPKPSPLPSETSSPSPSASASPTATPPALPDEARGTSEASAEAFVGYFFTTINYAVRTGDTKALRAASAPDCVSCSAIAGNVEKVYSAGGAIRGDGWSLRGTRLVQSTKRGAVLSLDVRLLPETVITSLGASPTSNQGGKQPMTIHLVRGTDGWVTSQLDLVS